MRFLYTSDWHLRQTTPVNRIENNFFYDVQLKKINDVFQIASKHNVDYIIHGGDLFDNWKVSLNLLGEVIYCLRQLLEKIGDNILYGILGNHDILGYNLNSINDTALGILIKNEQYCSAQKLFEKLGISSKVMDTRYYSDVNIKDYRVKDKLTIIISHDMITPVKAPFEHVYYKDIDGSATVVLCSHYHNPFIIETKKTVFLNPGALTRLSIDDRYEPGVILFDLEEDKKRVVNIKKVLLSGSRSYSVVFKEVKKEEEGIEIPKLDIEKISGQTILDKIIKSGRDFGEQKEIINEAVKRIEKAEKSIYEVSR